jgi:two-component system phosphate regulon sensor histidine kinase PhoR
MIMTVLEGYAGETSEQQKVKYTPEKGTVNIELMEDEDSIRFTIQDSGIGIPDSEKDRIFEEFYRASNAKVVSETGTGLGLAIAKSIVEQHNGTMEFESEAGKGTKFSIVFDKAKTLRLTKRIQLI